MGLVGILKFFLHRAVELLVIALIILFLPTLPPKAKFSKSISVAPIRPFQGPLALNDKLNSAEIWHKGDLLGPESFAEHNGHLYTSIHGGDVVKLTNGHITHVVKLGKACKGVYQEHVCGRPLGLRFDQNGNLYVADAYYGIFKVDVNTGKKVQLVSPNQEIDGTKPLLFNSVAVASNGDIYWTDSSTTFPLHDGLYDMFTDGSGRLIHYDAKTKQNKVLISNLVFANGVILADDESFVLVAESGLSRIHRYYLKGPKKGTSDIFLDGLPGMPDNLQSDGRDGFLVPLVIAVDKDHPSFPQILMPFPILRKLVDKFLGAFDYSFKLINQIYPNRPSEELVHFIGHFTMADFLHPNRVTVLHVSKNGEILDSIHALDGKLKGISEAVIYQDTLYLGSPFADSIGRVPLAKVGWEHLARPSSGSPKKITSTPPPSTQQASASTTTPRPTTTTPKPSTTTPRPTTTTPKPTTTTTTTPRPSPTTTKPSTTPTTTTSRAPPPTAKPTVAPSTSPSQAPPVRTATPSSPTTEKPAVNKQTRSEPDKSSKSGSADRKQDQTKPAASTKAPPTAAPTTTPKPVAAAATATQQKPAGTAGAGSNNKPESVKQKPVAAATQENAVPLKDRTKTVPVQESSTKPTTTASGSTKKPTN